MYAVEFNAHIENGIVHIPAKYANLQQVDAKITIMISDDCYVNNENNSNNDSEILSMTNSSANSIQEWKDEKEDEVWT